MGSLLKVQQTEWDSFLMDSSLYRHSFGAFDMRLWAERYCWALKHDEYMLEVCLRDPIQGSHNESGTIVLVISLALVVDSYPYFNLTLAYPATSAASSLLLPSMQVSEPQGKKLLTGGFLGFRV